MTDSETFLPASLQKLLRFSIPLYLVFITFMSLRAASGGSPIVHLDKLLHAGVYGLLALAINLAWPQISKLKIFIGVAIYGGLMEIAQGKLTAMRTPSIFDFTANAVGAGAALILIGFVTQKFAR